MTAGHVVMKRSDAAAALAAMTGSILTWPGYENDTASDSDDSDDSEGDADTDGLVVVEVLGFK